MKVTKLDNFGEGFKVAPRKPHTQPKSRPKQKRCYQLKVATGMRTKRGDEVLAQLLKNGFYPVSHFEGSGSYFREILANIRAIGYEIQPVREGNAIGRYELVKQ